MVESTDPYLPKTDSVEPSTSTLAFAWSERSIKLKYEEAKGKIAHQKEDALALFEEVI